MVDMRVEIEAIMDLAALGGIQLPLKHLVARLLVRTTRNAVFRLQKMILWILVSPELFSALLVFHLLLLVMAMQRMTIFTTKGKKKKKKRKKKRTCIMIVRVACSIATRLLRRRPPSRKKSAKASRA